MSGATVRRVIVTALALATGKLLIIGCPSLGGGTPEPAVCAVGMSINSSDLFAPGYWKSDIWTGLTPLDSTKDSVVLFTLPSCNPSCEGQPGLHPWGPRTFGNQRVNSM
jgi:hypothetical protein